MTFTVIEVGAESEKVVGTIWAGAETEAQAIVTDLLIAPENEKVVIRRAEDREVPLRPFE
jgi:hypothetical protein